MAMLTVDAASETSITKALKFRHSSNLHDASFSSYLNGAEETFIHRLADSSKNSKSLISTPFEHIQLVSKKVEDNEIDIFSADKYFNEGVDDRVPRIPSKCSPKINQKMDHPPELDPVKQQTRSGTPSIRSDSSWSSQKVLLKKIPQDQQPQKTNKVNYRRSFFANFGCNCSCSDKNSVDIDAPVGENSSSRNLNGKTAQNIPEIPSKAVDLDRLNESESNTWIREDSHSKKLDQLGIGLRADGHFRFPVSISNPKTGDSVLEMQRKQEEDSTRRKSLEVFGSPTQGKGKNSLNMLTWDAIVTKVEAKISENPRNGAYIDSDSDASSDLFEIESFCTNPGPYLTRQASDGMSSALTQTTCYAPSEASIEWSVVTASAADFSVMSDAEDLRSTTIKAYRRGMSQIERSTTGREMTKRRSGILSGCYSQKAVKVAEDVYRSSDKASPSPSPSPSPGSYQKPEILMPTTRFHAENELARFDKRNGHFSYDARLVYKH